MNIGDLNLDNEVVTITHSPRMAIVREWVRAVQSRLAEDYDNELNTGHLIEALPKGSDLPDLLAGLYELAYSLDQKEVYEEFCRSKKRRQAKDDGTPSDAGDY